MVKNPPATQETWVRFLNWEDPLEKGNDTHCSILAWEIPWMEEPGGLQSMWLQRVGYSLVTKQQQQCSNYIVFIIINIAFSWRTAWQPTPVFLSGESLWTEEAGGLQSIGLQSVGHH